MKIAKQQWDFKYRSSKQISDDFNCYISQPIIRAVETDQPLIVSSLLKHDANPNTLTIQGYQFLAGERDYLSERAKSLLDILTEKNQEAE